MLRRKRQDRSGRPAPEAKAGAGGRKFSIEPSSGPLPGKKQPSLFDGAPAVVDFLAPSVVREAAPGERSAAGRATHYWVEVGATAEPVRYYRSFHGSVTGGGTRYGLLDLLYVGDFGDGDCDAAIHVRPTDTGRELARIRHRIAAIESDLLSEPSGADRSDMRRQLADLYARRDRLRTGVEKLFYVTIQAVGSATSLDAARRYWNAMVRLLAGRGVVLRACDTFQLPAWLAASPLGSDVFRRFGLFRTMETSNVADLMSAFGLGGISHRSGVVLGVDELGRLVFYDGWHPRLENANIVIFGRSGAGKSVAVKTLTYRSAIAGIRTAIIDWEREYRVVVEAAGCPYVDIGPNSKNCLNIFDVDVEEDEEGRRTVHLEESIKAVEAVVLRMLRTMDPSLITGAFRVKLTQAVRRLYAQRGITEDPDSLFTAAPGFEVGLRRKEMPTLSDLVALLQSDPETAPQAAILKTFTRGGGSPSQAVFDGQTTVELGDFPILGFGLADLDEEVMRPIGTFVVTKWVWERVAKRHRWQKKRILVDEAQVAMSEPESAAWLENAFRRARKLNVSMCAVTQGFEVFQRVPQGAGILKNAPTKVLLKQESVDIDAVKGHFNLSEGEAMYLLKVRKGEGILRVGEESCRIYFELMPEELALFETNPNEMRKEAGAT